MKYSALTWQHFNTARHAGVLTGQRGRRGAAGNRDQGAWVQFDLLSDESDPGSESLPIREAKFLAFGCPHVIAVADWLAEISIGRTSMTVEPAALQQQFEVPIHKMGRLLVVEDAWIAALSAPYRVLTDNI
jgi:NifU-like protein involved in Fe-S cluster formation